MTSRAAASAAATQTETVYEVGPLDRALDLLEKLAETPDIPLVDLANAAGLNRATAFRHLKVLGRRGYVIQDPRTKRYALGYRLLDLGYHARSNLELPRVAAPRMADLSGEFNETVHLGVLMDMEVVHVAVVPSTHPLKMASEVGERTLVHVSALGKCLIAWQGKEALDALLSGPGLPRVSDRSIRTRTEFERELTRVRTQGFAVDDQESADGLRCVGAPIRTAGGAVIGAISLSGPVDRLNEDRLPEMIEAVRAAALQISRMCGWRNGR